MYFSGQKRSLLGERLPRTLSPKPWVDGQWGVKINGTALVSYFPADMCLARASQSINQSEESAMKLGYSLPAITARGQRGGRLREGTVINTISQVVTDYK